MLAVGLGAQRCGVGETGPHPHGPGVPSEVMQLLGLKATLFTTSWWAASGCLFDAR
jgi:hypothetical protein